MGVLGNNLNRVKNILAGKYTDKSKVSVGYKRATTRHAEGDVWEENGKTWTIKNGIKQTVSKLDVARQAAMVPYACPQCNKSLKHYLDANAWKTTKKCFDCNMKEETEMRANGTFEDHIKEIYKKNAMAWLDEKRKQFDDFINNPDSLKGFITEKGDIEDWYGNPDRTAIIEKFEQEYSEFKEKIEKL